jgi:prephenate dehydrogenase
MKKTMGIIGIGNFGQFIVPHLTPYFDVFIHDLADTSEIAAQLAVTSASFSQAASCDVVVFAVPVQNLKPVLIAASEFIQPNAIALDVSSVKVKPVELMKSILPESVRILGTHPLFGPESGKSGIKGLKVVLCHVRGIDIQPIKLFCENELKLEVLERSAQEHDKEMAMVQGLTHFLARALVKMDLQPCEMDTLSYNRMFDIMKLVGHDSMALFKTIQNENPYTDKVRADFVDAFKSLEEDLQSAKMF